MSNIEKKGVGWLGSKVAESKILAPYFKENDRTPSWDGNILVYDKAIKKENLKDTIPVQIKSTEVNSFHSGKISYSLDLLDIKNYYEIRGTILFVVEICERDCKVFAKSLLPSEIKNILTELEENKHGSKVFHLDELDTSTSIDLEYLCKHFSIHKKLQYSTIEHSLSITDASEIEIPLIFNGSSLEDHIFSKEHLLYGKPANETILRYITNAKISSVSQSLNKNITINSKTYFSQYEETHSPHGRISFEFGEKIIISIQDGSTANLSYKLTGILSKQIEVLSFLLDMLKTNTVDIGDRKLEINNFENKEDFTNRVRVSLSFLEDVKALLNSFRIDPDRLNTQIFEDRDITNLGFLVDVVIHNKRKETTPFQTGFNMVKVGNVNLGIFVYKKAKDNSYVIFDIFGQKVNPRFRASTDEEKDFEISMYVILKQDFLTLIDNLDLAIILEDIKRINFSKGYGNAVNIFGLELINAYDTSNRIEFLDAASNVFEWLQQKEYSLLNKINELQIIKRKRDYSKEEKSFLMAEKMENKDNNRILCAINILLENKSDATFNFDQLTETEKEEFIQFPIFNLAKKLKIFQE